MTPVGEVSPDLVQWAIGAAASTVVVMIGAVAFLVRISFRMGETAGEIKKVAADILSIKANTDKVPLLETKIGILEDAWKTQRSDHKELRKAVFRRSSPDFNGED